MWPPLCCALHLDADRVVRCRFVDQVCDEGCCGRATVRAATCARNGCPPRQPASQPASRETTPASSCLQPSGPARRSELSRHAPVGLNLVALAHHSDVKALPNEPWEVVRRAVLRLHAPVERKYLQIFRRQRRGGMLGAGACSAAPAAPAMTGAAFARVMQARCTCLLSLAVCTPCMLLHQLVVPTCLSVGVMPAAAWSYVCNRTCPSCGGTEHTQWYETTAVQKD